VLCVDFVAHQLRDPRLEEIGPWPVRLYSLLNLLHHGHGDVARWGCDCRGNCGSHSRVLVAMLQSREAHVTQLHFLDSRGKLIHTVVQASVDGRRVADGASGIVYRRRDGALATAADLLADTAFFRARMARVSGYPREHDD
jgi:hypothetical protein